MAPLGSINKTQNMTRQRRYLWKPVGVNRDNRTSELNHDFHTIARLELLLMVSCQSSILTWRVVATCGVGNSNRGISCQRWRISSLILEDQRCSHPTKNHHARLFGGPAFWMSSLGMQSGLAAQFLVMRQVDRGLMVTVAKGA